MSNDDNDLTDFERRLRASLQESVDHLDGATRSRLTRARHAALDEAQRRRATVDGPVVAGAAAGGGGGWPAWLSRPALLPAGAAAAALLAVVLVLNRGAMPGGTEDGTAATFQDIELLADNDAIALTQEEDFEFLEWAVAVGGERGGS